MRSSTSYFPIYFPTGYFPAGYFPLGSLATAPGELGFEVSIGPQLQFGTLAFGVQMLSAVLPFDPTVGGLVVEEDKSMATGYWALESDNVIRIDKLKDSATGDYVNEALVSATVQDESGVYLGQSVDEDGNVTGSPTTIIFTYQEGSQGQYVGFLPATAELTAGVGYTMKITISSPEFVTRVFKVKRLAEYDEE